MEGNELLFQVVKAVIKKWETLMVLDRDDFFVDEYMALLWIYSNHHQFSHPTKHNAEYGLFYRFLLQKRPIFCGYTVIITNSSTRPSTTSRDAMGRISSLLQVSFAKKTYILWIYSNHYQFFHPIKHNVKRRHGSILHHHTHRCTRIFRLRSRTDAQ